MNAKRIKTPLSEEAAGGLRAGEWVLINGTVYGARDAVHKKFAELIAAGKKLPVDLSGGVIYYAGPSPAPEGRAVGACGPTTSARMDEYTEPLLRLGLRGMIGKGPRSAEVIDAIKKYGAVYFDAVGGLGALLGKKIVRAEVAAFGELGTEALWEFLVEDFPAIVATDVYGKTAYRGGEGNGGSHDRD